MAFEPIGLALQVLLYFGLCINHSPEGAVETVGGIPPSTPGAFSTLFEAGNDLMGSFFTQY